MPLPQIQSRHVFFTGKGGVGKTSLSCASGLALAESGKRVLIVSTDPASNLDEVLGTGLSRIPTPIAGVSNLFALNIDPGAAADAYRERMVAPYRGILPDAAIMSMEEQFSGACTVEIAAFDEFSKLLGDPSTTADFDHVIFDTAPTGHTLRLLTLPSAWDEFISSSTGGASCLGPLSGLEKQKALYAATVKRLSDPEETTIVLVTRPEVASLREAARTQTELAELGLCNIRLAINGLFKAEKPGDVIADAMSERASKALAAMPANLSNLETTFTPFLPRGTVGLDALRRIGRALKSDGACSARPLPDLSMPSDLDCLIEDIARNDHGVVMTMGKGGVGKTSVAAAIAVALAERGHKVILTTTDPAAHVAHAVTNDIPNLTITRIDPELEVRHYADDILGKAGQRMDAAALRLLEEDLRSPCTEEIAVFRAFARTVDQGKDGFVVLDTAPTGHTILLLDAAEAFHREVMRAQGDMPESVRELLPRLRDGNYTRVLIVTLPESTPVHEAERLQEDLVRAGIQPYAWVINQSILASGTNDPLLCEHGAYEKNYIELVQYKLASRTALIPWMPLLNKSFKN